MNTNLKVGSKGSDVLQIQQYLQGLGLYNGALDGKFGPITDAAVRQFQQSQGIRIDGIVGPITRSKMTGASSNSSLKSAIENDPRFAAYINQPGGVDAIINAFNSGDWSKISGVTGMPFDAETANAELSRQMAVLDPYFKEDLAKSTADLTDTLGQSRRDFENYLDTSAAEFKADKDTQDVSAANNGVLFSTGRVEGLKNLEKSYATDMEYKRNKIGNAMGLAARDFQYKYGNAPASSLSNLYKLPGQSYNAFQPRGSVSSTGVSSVYNPSLSNFYGTNPALQKAQAIQRASGVLANKNNKLLASGYQYQF